MSDTAETQAQVRPFARRIEGEDVTIGDLERQVLVTIPVEALVSGDAPLPRPGVLVFSHDLAPVTVAMFALAMGGTALHELAHLAAARAAGVPARIGVGHLLWIVVAETDMTGI